MFYIYTLASVGIFACSRETIDYYNLRFDIGLLYTIYIISTHLGGERVVVDAVLGAVVVVLAVVYVNLLELIVVSQGSAGYVDSDLGLLIGAEDQKLAGIVQVSGDLKNNMPSYYTVLNILYTAESVVCECLIFRYSEQSAVPK